MDRPRPAYIQVAGRTCERCQDKISGYVDGRGCPQCKLFFHTRCTSNTDPCPKCGGSLLAGIELQALPLEQQSLTPERVDARPHPPFGLALILLAVAASMSAIGRVLAGFMSTGDVEGLAPMGRLYSTMAAANAKAKVEVTFDVLAMLFGLVGTGLFLRAVTARGGLRFLKRWSRGET